MTSLQRLVQSQRDLEASVLDTLERIDNHWAQLEELHTGVTLTKEGGRGYRDLDQARRGAQVPRPHVQSLHPTTQLTTSEPAYSHMDTSLEM